MTEVDLETLIRQAWRRSELRERLYRDLEVKGNDYLEQIIVNAGLMGYRCHEMDIWLNPFKLKASIDQVFDPPQSGRVPEPPPVTAGDVKRQGSFKK